MSLPSRNAGTARLLEELIASNTGSSEFETPLPSVPSPNNIFSTKGPEQSDPSLELSRIQFLQPEYDTNPSTPLNNRSHPSDDRALTFWNLSPRSPHTPVRKRAAPLNLPPPVSRAWPTAGEFEPTTPTPMPHSSRIKRLPSLQIDPASLEHWFHTGVYEDAHGDGEDIAERE
ncbi:hypothetical protein DFH09DRAFT_1303339 [Mycena vulgaris]|nr:hypothetical protein DFH09DRAFT_1303339 [Mycena vulgaris]